jgi:phosphoribosylformimino-5-aminoimidazole carboxamide ribotide isomerase
MNRTKNNAPIAASFVIPAIDIIGGKAVRLTGGNYNLMEIYHDHPLEVAKKFEDAGMKRLHLVDLDGAKDGLVKNWKVLEVIASKTSLVIDFSGGIKSDNDLVAVFDSGASYAAIGSVALNEEKKFMGWIEKYGARKFILAADAKNEKIVAKGWTQQSELSVYDFVEKYTKAGIQQAFCTDISKDGKLAGPSLDLYREIASRFPALFLIASGGVSSLKDLEDLKTAGCKAAIVGKAIYENRISLAELQKINELYL